MEQDQEYSEFGRGYAYCLGMFIGHEMRIWEYKEKSLRPDASMWFNGAADHLYELEIPSVLPQEKRDEISAWQNRCIGFRLCMDGQSCSFQDAIDACNYAKDLLREWDAFHGIPTIKGAWQ